MRSVRLVLIAALVTAIVVPALAADEVFEGTLVCAKCALKKDDAKECQDVLLVAQADGTKTEYYIAKNTVATEAGPVCTQQVAAKVTGTVSERDGRKWITASKIEKQGGGQPHAH